MIREQIAGIYCWQTIKFVQNYADYHKGCDIYVHGNVCYGG